MPLFAVVEDFINRTRRVASLSELDHALDDIAHELGFDFYALIQHVDIRKSQNQSSVWLENYPDTWAEVFVSSGLYASDPILMASHKTNIGFEWSEVGKLIKLKAHHRQVLATAAKEGMGDGFTVPAHIPGQANGTCNFAVKRGRTLPRTSLYAAQLVGAFAFEAGRRVSLQNAEVEPVYGKLTPRQLDCVLLVAKGKSDWEIGQILGIKEGTVQEYIEDACERFDVRRRVQLVIRAVHSGQISLSDAIG